MSDPPRYHAVSAHPLPDESLIGFVFRLAKLRRLPTGQALWTQSGHPNLTNRPTSERLQTLADNARIDVSELQAISYGDLDRSVSVFRGIQLPTTVFDRRGAADRRICPDCLAEAAYHRAIWDLTFIAACPIHLKLLIDACRVCGQPLKWTGGDLTRCTCQRGDLTRMATSSVSEADALGTKAVYGLLGEARFAEEADQTRTLTPFCDLGDGKIVEFLFRIGLELLAPRRKLFSMEQPNELAWEAHIALTRGLEVAEDWPKGLFSVLDAMASRVSGQPSLMLLRSVGTVDRWLASLGPEEGVAIRSASVEFRQRFAERMTSRDEPGLKTAVRKGRKPRAEGGKGGSRSG